jgi:hypothetical protein
MDKIMKLLEIAKKFGVKPSKVIGTQGNVVPYKKPSLVDISVDEFKLKESIDKGTLTMDKVQQEMEETVRLALSKNLNDVELNRALNNAINIDRQFFPPVADVYKLGVDEKLTGKGLEEVIQKKGRKYKPTSLAGEFETAGKKLEGITANLDEPSLDIGDVIKQAGKDQLSLTRMNDEGLVRATARQILSEDIRAGKIKSITLEDLGTMREPIEPFRKIYGEDALERLDSLIPDFNQLRTEQEAANLARSKFKFDPDETRTKGSMSYEELEKNIKGPEQIKEAKVSDFKAEATKRTSIDDLIDEYNANQDRLKLTDDEGGTLITYPEYNKLKDRNDEIAKALEEKGISSKIEEEVKEEGIVIPFRKKFPEPEGKAQGGIIGYALGGRTGFNKGKRVLDLIAKANKKLKGKKSMESVNPKTGEVTVPEEPIKPAEGVTVMKQEPIEGGFNFNDPDIKAQMEKAMQEGNKRSKEMRAMGLDPAKSKDYDEYIKIKETSGDKDFNKYFDDLEIKTKFKGVISDDLLNKILIDDNPQRKAEVIATIEQGLTMQEKGMSPEEIVNILKNTPRTTQAKGGPAGGLDYLMGF